jgi:hypothetical protein
MAFNLASVKKETAIRAPRILLLGVEKIGKTTFACGSRFENGVFKDAGANSPIVLPVKGEEGADGLGVPIFPTATSYADVMEAVASLYTEEHDYKTVVLDSASTLEPLICNAVCQAHDKKSIEEVLGGYGKGYVEALALWRDLLTGLDSLRNEKGMSSIIIGHVKVKRFDDPAGDAYDTYQMDMQDKASNMLYRWADLILFANTKVLVKKSKEAFGVEKKRAIGLGERFLYTQKRPSHPGGGRGFYGQLPYELPMEWQAFENAVANCIK